LLASQNGIQKFLEGSVTLHTDALCAGNEALKCYPEQFKGNIHYLKTDELSEVTTLLICF